MATLVDFDTHSPTAASSDRTLANRVTCNVACSVESFALKVSAASIYTVRVWDSVGTELGSGTAAGSGTFTVPLSSPVDLSAGVDYFFSVYAPGGGGLYSTGPHVDHDHTGGDFSFTQTEVRFTDPGVDGFPTGNVRDWCGSWSPNVSPAALTAALVPATETNAAPSIGRVKRKAIATVTETDTAPAVARQKTKALATATETDVAVAITATTPGIRVAIATVTETDEAPAITRTDPDTFLYRLTFPTYPRTFTPVPIGQTARFVLDQAVSIVRVNGTLRDFRSPSQTQLQAAGEEGRDWFIGGRIYEQIPNDVAVELRLAGFEIERVA